MAGAAGDIRIKVLGWIHLVLGAGGLLAGGFICAGLARAAGDKALAGPLFMLLAVVYFAPSLVSGWGLLAGRSWSRVMAFVVSALLAILFPVGTVLGAFGIWTVFTTTPQPVRRPELNRRAGAVDAAHEARLSALDPARVDTCIHLAPIETAMRQAGVVVRPLAKGAVRADCRVDSAALMAAFEPPVCVNYHEYFQEGATEDVPMAQVDCADHRSVIQVMHPLEAGPDTRWFPRPPAA